MEHGEKLSILEIKENVSLKPFNTFGIDARARFFTAFSSVAELDDIAGGLLIQKFNSYVLGGGSNILLTKDIDGIVMKNDIRGIEKLKEDDHHYYIRAGAGENWHQFVMHCVENDYAGVENLSLIPGNVGASPMQNIGAYGVEIKDVFHELEAYDLMERRSRTFTGDECEFGYRESIFKKKYKFKYAITSVTFRLNKKPVFNTSYGAIQQELEKLGVQELSIKSISDAVISIRSSKLPDPKEIGNAGSFFKNPEIPGGQYEQLQGEYPAIVGFPLLNGKVKLAAGWLIEQCGWKGYRSGDAGCYPKQALVLVNYGNASGNEIFELSEEIIQSVKNRFDVELEREVNVL